MTLASTTRSRVRLALLSLAISVGTRAAQSATNQKDLTPPAAKFAASTSSIAKPRSLSDQAALRDKLAEIDGKIKATKEQMRLMKNSDFLIGLYFNLGDLFAEKSRALLTLKMATNPDTPESELDLTKERRPKQEAIEIYQKIFAFFPKSDLRDRALFYEGHEERDLGDFTSMLKTYQQIVRDFPASPYWNETQILIGDFLMEERKDIDGALARYDAVAARPINAFTSVAHYRAGWCHINKLSYGNATASFQKSIETYAAATAGLDTEHLPEVYRKVDVRKEAVLSMVTPFVELYAEHSPLIKIKQNELTEYFLSSSDGFGTYQKALSRLSRRFGFKGLWQEAADVNLELASIAVDPSVRTDAMTGFYEAFKKGKIKADWSKVLTVLGDVVQDNRVDEKISEKERTRTLRNFEIVARDACVTLDRVSRTSRAVADYSAVADAYKLYERAFPTGTNLAKMQMNRAESLFNAKRYLEAGIAYEHLHGQNSQLAAKKSKRFDESSVESYVAAMQDPDKLSPTQILQARRGLRDQGEKWLTANARKPGSPTVRFNIALSLYEEKEHSKAITAFRKFIAASPSDPRAREATMMIVNSYSQNEDNVGLAKAGPSLLKTAALSAEDRARIQDMMGLAQRKQLQALGDFGSRDYAKKLRSIASQQRGTGLGDAALAEAFDSLQSKRDVGAYEVGEELLARFSDSGHVKKVAAGMAKMAITTADYGRAATYFETYAKKYPKEKESLDWLKTAAQLREWLGDYRRSAADRRALREPERAARMDFLATDWPALEKSSSEVNGLSGRYWKALSLYRQNRPAATAALRATAASSGRTAEERDMVAHASYLLASGSLRAFKAIQMRDANDVKALQAKVAGFKSLQDEFGKVAKLGSGRWTIAALFGLGSAGHQISKFMLNAPTPPGLTPDQSKQYADAIAKQAAPFEAQAQTYFADCLATAEKNEIFTRFVNGCLAKGDQEVDEAEDVRMQARSSDSKPDSDPGTAAALRAKLFDTPRDLATLYALADAYADTGNHATASAIYNRILEIDDAQSRARASVGVMALFMNDLDRAHDELKKALVQNGREPIALWNLAGLYSEFQFSKKAATIKPRAKATARPKLIHPFARSL